MVESYKLGDIVQMKKEHACHLSKDWEIIRTGVDIKIKCLGCEHVVMMPRIDFEKKCKKVVKSAE